MNTTPHTTLIIPNYVTAGDIPKIWHFFDYFNIAKVKDIEYYNNNENSQLDQYYGYGYVIILIDEWYNNTGAKNFYESIVDNKCRMVYDDPYYWNVEFYYHVHEHEHEDEHEDNIANQDLNEIDNESYYDYESESEPDDAKDLDYEFKETDDEIDRYYEYYDSYHTRLANKVKTVKKQQTNKNSESNDKNVVNLSDQLVKKNKNYLKNNKTKSFKNEWSRRLRRKIE